jgi:hypothetical protein
MAGVPCTLALQSLLLLCVAHLASALLFGEDVGSHIVVGGGLVVPRWCNAGVGEKSSLSSLPWYVVVVDVVLGDMT